MLVNVFVVSITWLNDKVDTVERWVWLNTEEILFKNLMKMDVLREDQHAILNMIDSRVVPLQVKLEEDD